MHITKLSLVNYRNFKHVNFIFNKGINTIVGENGSGKSNLFRAMRLLLDNSMSRSAINLTENDFCRALGNWRGHWVIISMEFSDISSDEASQSLFLHGLGNAGDEVVTRATYNLIFRPKANIRQALALLPQGNINALEAYLEAITIDDYETVLTGKSSINFNDPVAYKSIVGDFERVIFPARLNNSDCGIKLPNILNIPNEVSFTFIKALRDVVSDFHSNKSNPLLTLLKSKSGGISNADFEPIADLIGTLNSNIEGLKEICDIRDDIVSTIGDAVGDTYAPNSISIRSALTDDADQLFQSLKLFVGESSDGHEGTINEMSLGGANLLFLTLKLLEFKYQHANQSIANFLLIEEPEAHIHTHVQKSLFDNISYENTQIIYSTHSSNISEVSNIRNMNIIGFVDGACEVFQPARQLIEQEIGFVQRYLDAIRSNLLFARSVILVEGDAEELLIPILIKKVLGLSLDEIGITLVNIRSTGFENVALLFDKERIKKRCSIITDLDKSFFDTTIFLGDSAQDIKKKEKAIGSQTTGAARKVRLDAFCQNNPWVSTFYAEHTFEVDFLKSSNSYYIDKIVGDVYTQQATIDLAKSELSNADIAVSGSRALTMANYQGKGWFALTLGSVIDFKVVIPDYIFGAIKFAHGGFSKGLICKILKHRYYSVMEHVKFGKENIERLDAEGNFDLKQAWERYLAPYESGLAVFTPKWEAFNQVGGDIDLLKVALMNDLPFERNGILARI